MLLSTSSENSILCVVEIIDSLRLVIVRLFTHWNRWTLCVLRTFNSYVFEKFQLFTSWKSATHYLLEMFDSSRPQ